MEKIENLKTIKGDAYDYYAYPSDADDLFEKIFLVGGIVDAICQPSKIFLIGEKGSGKTAYSVYMAKKKNSAVKCSISMVNDLLYRKFLNMKRSNALVLSDMKDVWLVILYLVVAEKYQETYGKSIFSGMKFKKLKKAIDAFYSDAFKPELVNAFEFVQNASSSINLMAAAGVFSSGHESGKETQEKYVEHSYQISLLKLQKGFEEAFEELGESNSYILFIDGIDARPVDIDNKEYFECITGLVNAVLELNRGVLAKKHVKVMPLMRPDVMYRIPVQNMNQKVRDNSVLLNWDTSYKGYVKSKLFKIAGDYFAKQQTEEIDGEKAWDYYFPYKIPHKNRKNAPSYSENAFVEFLRYSSYKPRDILTMLNEMVMATKGSHFSHDDFFDMLNSYSGYLEGELKDYLLIYMTEENYEDFRLFFDYFHGMRDFSYAVFKEKHLEYIHYLKDAGRQIPPEMDTVQRALQLLYDANVIGYRETFVAHPGKSEVRVHWSFKERTYANVRPNVRMNETYMFHLGYSRAFGIW